MLAKMKYTWLFIVLLAVVSVAIGILEFVGEWQGEFHWSSLNAFSAAFGFVGCVALVFVAKWLGRHFLQRHKDYYE